MNMLVETYEDQEVAEETPEVSEEALGVIEELGLEGQQKLFSENKDGEKGR